MPDFVQTLLIGFAGGIAGWLLTRTFLAPRLAWSAGITQSGSGTKDDPFIHSIKVQNVGWFRSITEVELDAALYYWISRVTNRVIHLPLSSDHMPRLIPGANSIGHVLLDSLGDATQARVSRDGHAELFEGPSPDLLKILGDDLTWRGDSAVKRPYILVRALATDGWTSARQYRMSARYYHEDVHASTVFETRQGLVARVWRKGHEAAADARSRVYHSKVRMKRRPSLQIIPSQHSSDRHSRG